MIAKGYDAGIVRIIDSPHGDGAVCQIGDNWFYFGGQTAERETAASYVRAVPRDDIVRSIYEVLEDFRRESGTFGNEYMYYEAILREWQESIRDSKPSLPYILEFHYESIDSDPDTLIWIAFANPLSSKQVSELEDSITSYLDSVPDWEMEKLINDVLSEAGYEFIILSPDLTIYL